MTSKPNNRRSWMIWRPLSVGFLATIFLGGVMAGWGSTAQISGAVIASGKVQVTTMPTSVQHPVGGVVSEIAARDGDIVEAGDVVVRLDDTPLRSELAITEGELFEILANEARLNAIIEDRADIVAHPLLLEAASDKPKIAELLQRQERQLRSQLATMQTQSRLIQEQVRQFGEQISGVEAELEAKRQHRTLIEDELEKSRGYLDRGLIKLKVVSDLQKDVFKTIGEIGKLTAKIAELRGKISEYRIKEAGLLLDLQEKSADKLSLLVPQRVKLMEKRNKLINDLSNLEIRTPISGIIHASTIMGLRSVVVAAKPLMSVIPNTVPAIVTAKVRASDIDQVYFGQDATLRFVAFHRRSTPVIEGRIINVSADAVLDSKTSKLFYDVEIEFKEDELAKLGDKNLVSGMPVVAYITTEDRTPLAYVTRPLMDYLNRAFRDS